MPPSRAEKARATRRRMLDAAGSLFVEHGWAGTSVADVAHAAGVAVQTVYYTFRTKRALFAELLDVRVAGDDDPVPTLERGWARDALAASDPREHLRRQVAGTRAVHERVAALLRVLREAAPSHPELAELWDENRRQRLVVADTFTRSLATKTTLRLDPARARDAVAVTLGPEVYDELTSALGWPPDRWEDWARDTLERTLLDSPSAAHR